MRTRVAAKKTRLNRWARKIGRLTARTEMTAWETRGELERKVKDFKAKQASALKKLTEMYGASHRALKEFKAGMGKAAADLDRAIHRATGQFQHPTGAKGIRATIRGRRRRR